MVYFIDVQGFKGPQNSFIVKEIALLNDQNEFQHFIVNSPYDINNLPPYLQSQAYYVYQKHHGIEWSSGFTPLDSIIVRFSHVLEGHIIYVKGAAKIKWIKDLFRLGGNADVQDLSEQGCPSIENLRRTFPGIQRCVIHHGVCALQNVLLLKMYIQNKDKNM